MGLFGGILCGILTTCVGPHVIRDTRVGLVACGWLGPWVLSLACPRGWLGSWVLILACPSTDRAYQQCVSCQETQVLLGKS